MHEIVLEDATTGERATTLGHLTVLGGRRADRLWARLAGSGLAERAARFLRSSPSARPAGSRARLPDAPA